MQPGATEPKPVPAYDRHSGGWREGQPLPRQGAHTTHPPTPTPRAHLRGRGSPGVARARRSVACRSRPQRGWTRGSAVPAGVWGQSRRWPKSRRPGRMGAGANGVEGGDRQRRCGIHTVGGGGRGVLVPAKPSFVWTTAGEAGDLLTMHRRAQWSPQRLRSTRRVVQQGTKRSRPWPLHGAGDGGAGICYRRRLSTSAMAPGSTKPKQMLELGCNDLS